MIKKIFLSLSVASVLTITVAGAAEKEDRTKVVWGGGKQESSTYSGKYVPQVIDALGKVRMSGYEWGGVSAGTIMNAEKVTANPTHLAVGQNDLLQANKDNPEYDYTILKDNIGPECLYMVTKELGYENLGHVFGNSWDLTLVTGSKKSGSFGTWDQVLTKTYPDLQDMPVVHTGGTSDIINTVANSQNPSVGFFVMRPDPNSKIFKDIKDKNLKFIPVIDMDLEDKYQFYSLKVAHSGLFGMGKGKFVETSCTSVALITGNPEKATGRDKKRLQETIKRVSSASNSDFTPTTTDFRDTISSMTKMSSEKIKQMADSAKQTANSLAEAAKDKINEN